jgi:hypothetical protein
MKLIDRDRRGFARYCPTLADACSRAFRREMTMDGLSWKPLDMRRLLKASKAKQAAQVMKEDNKCAELAVEMLSDPDEKVRAGAADAIRRLSLDSKKILENAVGPLADAALEESEPIRRNAVKALWEYASKRVDISAAVPALANAIYDMRDADIRRFAIFALSWHTDNNGDISEAVPALANALSDDYSGAVSRSAALALKKAATWGQDISKAVPALVKALFSFYTRPDASSALILAAGRCDLSAELPLLLKALCSEDAELRKPALYILQRNAKPVSLEASETRAVTIYSVNKLMRSEWFEAEMHKNSVDFVQALIVMENLLGQLRQAEEAA